MADTIANPAQRSANVSPLDPVQLHTQATNALQRCILELQCEPTRYDIATRHLASASTAVLALSVADSEPPRTQACNDDASTETKGSEGTNTAALVVGTLAYRKAYCDKLCKVICRYLNDSETEELARTLQRFAEGIAARRYCPGLNDATYDLFARFAIK